MAIASLTTSDKISLNGKKIKGTRCEPDFVLNELCKLVKKVYDGRDNTI